MLRDGMTDVLTQSQKWSMYSRLMGKYARGAEKGKMAKMWSEYGKAHVTREGYSLAVHYESDWASGTIYLAIPPDYPRLEKKDIPVVLTVERMDWLEDADDETKRIMQEVDDFVDEYMVCASS